MVLQGVNTLHLLVSSLMSNLRQSPNGTQQGVEAKLIEHDKVLKRD